MFVPAPRAYGKDGYSEEMEQLLESMEAANISPSRKVFMEVADVYGLSTNAIKSVTKQPIHKKAEFAADANYWWDDATPKSLEISSRMSYIWSW